MATDQNSPHGRRPHFHRGRRQDRRGNERRGAPPPPPEQGTREGGRDNVDVEHIMREIRTRISQRHGIELTTPQIQELAARRLEAILDPRTVKPSLLEQIRRSAATPADASPVETAYAFEESTIYESHRGSLRFMRRLLNPLLKLFFNPNPLIHALNLQAQLNKTAAAREAERERRQAEWNALHYDILQRLVTEIARTSIEAQSLAMRVEALSAKVDFAERRARSLEGSLHQARPAQRPLEVPSPVTTTAPPMRESAAPQEPASAPAASEGTGESGRRRRRRRRGRRPQGFVPEGSGGTPVAGGAGPDLTRAGGLDEAEPLDGEDSDEDDGTPDTPPESDDFAVTGTTENAPHTQPTAHEMTQQSTADEPAEPAPTPAATTPQNDQPSTDVIDRPDPFRPSEG